MLFDQLVRLFVALFEFGLIVVLAGVFFVGYILFGSGFSLIGMLLMLGVAWFVLGALVGGRR